MLRWGFEEASGTIQDLYMPFNISTDPTISGSAFVFARATMATFDNEHCIVTDAIASQPIFSPPVYCYLFGVFR